VSKPFIFARVYVEMRTHEKIWPLPDSQYRLYVDSLMWCRDRLTDGFIAEALISQVSPIRSPRSVAQALAKAGLFDRCDGGWMIHDYAVHQDTNDVIEERRKHRQRGANETNRIRWSDRSSVR